jgi:hypothetical protein
MQNLSQNHPILSDENVSTVAGALDDAAMVHGNCGINQSQLISCFTFRWRPPRLCAACSLTATNATIFAASAMTTEIGQGPF